MSATAIIPARLGSTRFPGKVLKAETGKPLVVHVCERAAIANLVSRVVVATDSPEVADVVSSHGFEAVMTSPDHPNGTCRLAEASRWLDLPDDALVVNVQGDEPEIDPVLIDETIDATVRSGEPMGTLASPFRQDDDPLDTNIVKAVVREGVDGIQRAVYFSRALIPHNRDGLEAAFPPLKHAGLYVYRRDALDRFVSMPESLLERTERLEQLRAVEAGWGIAVVIRSFDHVGIDTEAQYRSFVARHNARSSGI
ncbi:MAG: 3-deoxy-manno-octulosonate cytidylyltransferase [Phycisphaerales bacterium]